MPHAFYFGRFHGSAPRKILEVAGFQPSPMAWLRGRFGFVLSRLAQGLAEHFRTGKRRVASRERKLGQRNGWTCGVADVSSIAVASVVQSSTGGKLAGADVVSLPDCLQKNTQRSRLVAKNPDRDVDGMAKNL